MNYFLGIDVGTSKIAAVLLDSSFNLVEKAIEPTGAELDLADAYFDEQNTEAIWQALLRCVNKLSKEKRERVLALGLTGQMHGVCLWKRESVGRSSPLVSNLITWQDRRCLKDGFIEELQSLTGESTLSTGFGCATLAWFKRNNPALLKDFDAASTIHDFIAARLCGSTKSFTDPTDAASWGLFDIYSKEWQREKIEMLGIEAKFLPEVLPTGSVCGELRKDMADLLGLKNGIPVTLPIGDNQASILATVEDPKKDISLTIGTGSQLSLVVESKDEIPKTLAPSVDVRPYLGDSYALVAASLVGGSAIKWLAEFIEKTAVILNAPSFSKEELYSLIDNLGKKAFREEPYCKLEVIPTFLGERHKPDALGEIKNIGMKDFTLENLSYKTAFGLLKNLKEMFPEDLLKKRGRIIGSGNGIRKLSLIQELVPYVFQLPLKILPETEEAAKGAAILSAKGQK
ncbi:MAG: hypothetical protein D6780_03625 [Candidatus Dadabacteria bacterium]|nr:MAG: hypothetical protein D6780_03625 [Candidatus Dadabacteria bacterium]